MPVRPVRKLEESKLEFNNEGDLTRVTPTPPETTTTKEDVSPLTNETVTTTEETKPLGLLDQLQQGKTVEQAPVLEAPIKETVKEPTLLAKVEKTEVTPLETLIPASTHKSVKVDDLVKVIQDRIRAEHGLEFISGKLAKEIVGTVIATTHEVTAAGYTSSTLRTKRSFKAARSYPLSPGKLHLPHAAMSMTPFIVGSKDIPTAPGTRIDNDTFQDVTGVTVSIADITAHGKAEYDKIYGVRKAPKNLSNNLPTGK